MHLGRKFKTYKHLSQSRWCNFEPRTGHRFGGLVCHFRPGRAGWPNSGSLITKHTPFDHLNGPQLANGRTSILPSILQKIGSIVGVVDSLGLYEVNQIVSPGQAQS